MNNQLSSNWWLFLLRGFAAIAIGIIIMFNPTSLLLFFGIFALVDGSFALVAAMFGYGKNNEHSPTWWLLVTGIAGILAGIFIFKFPAVTIAMLLLFIAAWSITSGIFAMFGALGLHKGARGKAIFFFNGLLSLAFGILVLLMPVTGAITIAWITAFYSIFIGFSLIGFSFQLRKEAKSPADAPSLATS